MFNETMLLFFCNRLPLFRMTEAGTPEFGCPIQITSFLVAPTWQVTSPRTASLPQTLGSQVDSGTSAEIT